MHTRARPDFSSSSYTENSNREITLKDHLIDGNYNSARTKRAANKGSLETWAVLSEAQGIQGTLSLSTHHPSS